jgi:hypothetical protein
LNCLWRARIFFGGLLWLIGMPNRGYWFWDLRTKELCWCANMESVYGVPHDPKGYTIGEYDSLFASALWDDRTRSYVNYAVELAKQSRSVFTHDFRVRDQTTNELKIVHGRGQWIYENGKPVGMFGYNSVYRLNSKDKAFVDSALAIEELQHAASNPNCPTPDTISIACGLMSMAQCFHSLTHHVRG